MGGIVRKILAALDGMAILRRADGRFTLLGEVPEWCRRLRRMDLHWDAPFDVEDAFPFLSAFLPEAEEAWAAASPARAESDLWTEVDRTGSEIHLEAIAVNIDGARVIVILRSDRLFRESQTLLQRARELRLTHSALMKELEQKDILVHAIVHDLAAPLHSILGVLSLLREQPSAATADGWLQLATQAALRQRQLITEILEVFAASDDALGTHGGSEGVELDAVLAGAIAERAPVARRREIHLETSVAPALGRVVGDDMRLFRVLTNLIDNALRHTPAGRSVRVSAQREEAVIVVCVEDDGPGVSAEVLPRLFEKFARGGAAAGTGLGLFYCRITVENWGGGIGYEPRREGGSRFWVRLPTAQPHSGPRLKEAANGEALAAR